MANRSFNIHVFQETETILHQDPQLIEAVNNTISTQTVLKEKPDLSAYSKNHDGRISITTERTFQAAQRLGEKTAVLNFANAFHAGGGVRSGSNAQEESLCRVSTLYPCLYDSKVQQAFYLEHDQHPDFRGYDDCILSKGILVFRKDDETNQLLKPEERYAVDVITCAAPDQREYQLSDQELSKLMEKRTKRILEAAVYMQDVHLVLGAFGCGAFRCDPYIVSRAMQKACAAYCGYFDQIVFAIYANRKDDPNYEAFRSVFGHA